MPRPPRRLLVGLSGGADSVALLRGLHQLRGEFAFEMEAAHFNHGLRGAASAADEHWSRRLCQQLEIPCHHGRISPASPSATKPFAPQAASPTQPYDAVNSVAPTPALLSPNMLPEQGPSENQLRQSRHQFLLATAQQHHCDAVCLGHHAQDQLETLLHHLLRGTSLRGLLGIPLQRPFGPGVELLHPLLTISPATIRDYLHQLQQDFRSDASNQQTDYTRNRIRLELLPLLEQLVPQAQQHVLQFREQIAETWQFQQALVAELRPQILLQQSPTILRLRLPLLRTTQPLLVRELFVSLWQEQNWPRGKMSRQHWQHLQQLAQSTASPTARQQFPGHIDAQRTGDLLRLERLHQADA